MRELAEVAFVDSKWVELVRDCLCYEPEKSSTPEAMMRRLAEDPRFERDRTAFFNSDTDVSGVRRGASPCTVRMRSADVTSALLNPSAIAVRLASCSSSTRAVVLLF